MTNEATLAYAEQFKAEDHHLQAARRHAQTVGVVPVLSGARAALTFLAGAAGAHNIAEIGTGTGVSGLALLRGMVDGGVLTSVDLEAENQRLARQVFVEAGFAPTQFRLITGSALQVLPRLTDHGYDMVFCDGDKVEYAEYLDEALRITRPGGFIVFDNALWHDRVADPSQRDPETMAIRELVERIGGDEDVAAMLIPLGDGLLVIQKPA